MSNHYCGSSDQIKTVIGHQTQSRYGDSLKMRYHVEQVLHHHRSKGGRWQGVKGTVLSIILQGIFYFTAQKGILQSIFYMNGKFKKKTFLYAGEEI